MTYEVFLLRVLHRTGLDDRAHAQEVCHRVISHLSTCLAPELRHQIAHRLPEPLGATLREPAEPGVCDLDVLYRAVADDLGLATSFGLEFSRVVFQVIGESLGRGGRAQLTAALPEDWQELFEPRGTTSAPPRPHPVDLHRLAGGAPGSAHPVSESRPGHRHSVARSDEPHAGDEMATSHGKADRRTLAGGRPGSSRPLSEG